MPPLILEHYDPPDVPVSILYEDETLLFAAKPSGLLSVPGRGDHLADCMIARVQHYSSVARLVHRLDMGTSGVMVFAKTSRAQKHLGLQFEKRRVKKRYQALLWGHLKADAGTVDLPLICDWPNRPKQMVSFEHGKQAVTRYDVIERTLQRGCAITRVSFEPETGRSHQLRVHADMMGHPILGDSLYGHSDSQSAMQRLALHAEMLAVTHPETHVWTEITDPTPF